MTGQQLKAWAVTLHDDATIEIHRYNWEPLNIKEVRATWISTPVISMADVCNAEQVAS